jgi:hypothetical protein
MTASLLGRLQYVAARCCAAQQASTMHATSACAGCRTLAAHGQIIWDAQQLYYGKGVEKYLLHSNCVTDHRQHVMPDATLSGREHNRRKH